MPEANCARLPHFVVMVMTRDSVRGIQHYAGAKHSEYTTHEPTGAFVQKKDRQRIPFFPPMLVSPAIFHPRLDGVSKPFF